MSLDTDLNANLVSKTLVSANWKKAYRQSHEWTYGNQPALFENPADCLHTFILEGLTNQKAQILSLKKQYNVKLELHLVIGIGDVLKDELWPDTRINHSDLGFLHELGIDLHMYFEMQMSRASI